MLRNIILRSGEIFFSFLIGIILIYHTNLFSQDFLCGTTEEAPEASSQTGGIYLTSQGTLKLLIVFARFKDDTTTTHNWWPQGVTQMGGIVTLIQIPKQVPLI